MRRDLAVGLAITAVIVGGAGVLYVVNKGGLGGSTATNFQVQINPPGPYALGQPNQLTAVATWDNQGPATTWAVQGTNLGAGPLGAAGVITGHWWTSPNIEQQAESLYTDHLLQQAYELATVPANRLAVVKVAANSPGTANLYGAPTAEAGESWVFWLAPVPSSGLILPDPVGGTIPASVPAAKYTVQVVTS